MHPIYDLMIKDLQTDLRQMLETGHEEATLQAELTAARAAGTVDVLAKLQEAWWERPSPTGYPYVEPDDWETLRAGFPDPDSHARVSGDEAELANRLHAGWLGRCAGCQLGKPLEGLVRPERIRAVLETVGSWPLTDYMNPVPEGTTVETMPDVAFFEGWGAQRRDWCRGRFVDVAPDDDIHYALTSLMLLEQHGVAFTPQQAIDVLTKITPIGSTYAAGRNMYRTAMFGVSTPRTAVWGNPCRQSLGAMIRCDPFGWCAPGNPALAAEMAYKDAVNSQVRNGIYSGVFFAVLLADTLAHHDPLRAIETATAYVPPKSKFAEMIQLVKTWCSRTDDWQKVDTAILERWPQEAQQFNHSLTNGAIVLTGLLLGGGDFTRTLGITVMCGLDTDCTGATVGSIMGCALGTRGIPQPWTEPFHDTIRTDLRGAAVLRISDVARRTFLVARQHARR